MYSAHASASCRCSPREHMLPLAHDYTCEEWALCVPHFTFCFVVAAHKIDSSWAQAQGYSGEVRVLERLASHQRPVHSQRCPCTQTREQAATNTRTFGPGPVMLLNNGIGYCVNRRVECWAPLLVTVCTCDSYLLHFLMAYALPRPPYLLFPVRME